MRSVGEIERGGRIGPTAKGVKTGFPASATSLSRLPERHLFVADQLSELDLESDDFDLSDLLEEDSWAFLSASAPFLYESLR